MFGRIKKFRRYLDYFYFKGTEVWLSIFLTAIFSTVILGILDVYSNIEAYQGTLKSVIGMIVGGEFGLLGMSLAGIALITGMLTPEFYAAVRKIDKNETIDRLLSQYEFSAFNLILQMTYLFLIYFCISSTEKLIGEFPFNIIFVLVLYHFFFNIFYILALIGVFIKLNSLKNKSEIIRRIDKTDCDVANELRIDYILAVLLKEKGIHRDELLRSLDNMIEQSDIQDKDSIKKYFYDYYGN